MHFAVRLTEGASEKLDAIQANPALAKRYKATAKALARLEHDPVPVAAPKSRRRAEFRAPAQPTRPIDPALKGAGMAGDGA